MMKDKESSAITNKMQESQVAKEDEREKSRGKRRTAREIAQMFEQLKQRHKVKKREWQLEKQELLKQAIVAEDSKLLLVELKCLLKELRSQLGTEETNRKLVESEFDKAKADWKQEKDRLLKIIANSETKRVGKSDRGRNLTEELDTVKSQLLAREKDLALIQKSNSEIQKSTQEMQKRFDGEKLNMIKSYEGEKRNWEKARQVMLDKIETLQEELRNSRIDAFPLHGSHVGSPFDDAISALMSSPEMDDYYSTESRTPAAARISIASTNFLDSPDTTYGHFQRTVDEALNQIEKLTQDLKQVTNNPSDQVQPRVDSQSLILSPQTSSSAGTSDNSRLLSMNASYRQKDKSNKLKIDDEKQPSSSPVNPHFDRTKSQYLNSSSLEPSEIATQKPSDNSQCSNRKTSFSKTSQDSVKLCLSPEASLSPSDSCSIPTFTESSADSPQIPSLLNSEETTKSSTSSSQVRGTPDKSSFTKIDKNYSTPVQQREIRQNSSEGSSTKKLPNLHKQLLFGGSSQKGTVRNDGSTKQENITSDNKRYSYSSNAGNATFKQQQQNQKQTPNANKSKQAVKPESSQRKQNVSKLFRSADFVNESISVSTKTDSDKSNLDIIPAPPVRPKPSVTIEKDTRGNVLRVISDPRYSRQESPRRMERRDETEARGRRQQREDSNDFKASISDKTNVNSFTQHKKNRNLLQEANNYQEKETIGSRGKSWIKKRLSFLDAPPKEDENVAPKSIKKGEKTTSKLRSSSSQRGEGRRSFIQNSSSDESDVASESIRRKPSKKEAGSKRGKPKRYTRSKTDSTMDVRNLLAKFKASQFNSKKPSIVKEFEKKLLENEVKTLENDKEKENQGSGRQKESMRMTPNVREKRFEEDEGYRGEDELDHYRQKRRGKSKTLPATSTNLVRSPSIRSLQEQLFDSRSSPRRSIHRSMIDLSSVDDNKNFERPDSPQEIIKFHKKQQSKNIHSTRSTRNTTQKSQNLYEERQSFGSGDTTNRNDIQTGKTTSAQTLTLPDTKVGGKFGKKRLSWAANLQQSFEDGPDGAPPPSPRKTSTSDRTTTTAVSGILLKPKSAESSGLTSLSKESNSKNSEFFAESDNKNKGRMSQEMKKKADNLEKVLKKGPNTSKPRKRYKRSETQPIACSPATTEETDSECNPSQGMVRSHSMSSETFTKEFHDDLTPTLTSRFKKPTLTNRRLPSRWKKKLSNS